MRKTTTCLLLFAVIAMVAPGHAQSGEFAPSKEITMIVPSSAGGGSDINARTIGAIVQKHNLSPRNIMVVNNGGGSGAIGFTNTYARKGDNHTLMILHSGQVMGGYVNDWQVKSEHLTYVAVLARDNLYLAVRGDSPYKSIEALLKAAKDNPGEIVMGGSQRGNTDHLAYVLLTRETGADIPYVSFDSQGDVMAALLGGHVDFGIFTPFVLNSQIGSGNVIPIVAYAEKRLGGDFADVPTFIEVGYPELVVTSTRAIAAPPEISPEALDFYVEMLRKVTETDEWKNDYIVKNHLEPIFFDAEQTKKYYEGQIDGYMKGFEGVDLSQ